MLRLATILGVLAIGADFPAARAHSPRTIAGAGTSLCSAFVQEFARDPQTTAWIYLSWAQGYLSAVNLQRARLGEPPADMIPPDFDLPRQMAFLRTYCREFPDQHFDQAATKMYYELRSHHAVGDPRQVP